MKTCYVCGNKYDENKLTPITYSVGSSKYSVSKIKYQDENLSLCPTCFRQFMLQYIIRNNYTLEDLEECNE